MTAGLLLVLALSAGPVLSGCTELPVPLPILDAEGFLAGTATDTSGRIHAVIMDDDGLKYGILDGLFMTPELVASEAEPWGSWLRGALALAPDGTPHVLYHSPSSSSNVIHAWKASGVWESEITDMTVYPCMVAGQCTDVDMAVDSSGDVHVSYMSLVPSYGYEVRYARKHAGEWNDELIETISDLFFGCWSGLTSKIALDPDDKPVIVSGGSALDFDDCGDSDAVIRVAQPADGGGWQIEQIFSFDEYSCSSASCEGSLEDLELEVGPSGEKAVFYIFYEFNRAWYRFSYRILTSRGAEWNPEYTCGCLYDYDGGGPYPCSCQAGDIAFDSSGQLYALSTREEYDGPPGPDTPIRQSIMLAHRAGAEWSEETLWDNSLYNAGVPYYLLGVGPALIMTGASTANVLYNLADSEHYLPTSTVMILRR